MNPARECNVAITKQHKHNREQKFSQCFTPFDTTVCISLLRAWTIEVSECLLHQKKAEFLSTRTSKSEQVRSLIVSLPEVFSV